MRALAEAGRRYEPRSRLRSPAGAILGLAIVAAVTALLTTFAEARALPPIEDRSDTRTIAAVALTVLPPIAPASIAPEAADAAVVRDIGSESLESALRALASVEYAPRAVEAPAATASDVPARASSASAEPSVLAANAPSSPVAAPPSPAAATPGTTFANVVPPSPVPSTATEAAAPAPAEPRFELTVRERGLLDAMNREREAAGIAPLRLDVMLIDIARERSQDMVDNSYFAHFGPNGESTFALVGASGRRFSAVGENLARVRGDEGDSVRFAITNLMASAPHRRNILKERYTLVGVGTMRNAIGLTVFTTVFAAE